MEGLNALFEGIRVRGVVDIPDLLFDVLVHALEALLTARADFEKSVQEAFNNGHPWKQSSPGFLSR